MAVTYGFYNSLNGDRTYNAEQMSAIFDGIITDGVFGAIGGALMTIAGEGMQVLVKTGKAWFNGTWTLNDAQMALPVSTSDVSLTRIDAVVLEVNSSVSVRENSIKIVKGTPSANPTKPTMAADEDLHQYALAYITVGAGVTSITSANIEVNVGKDSCPFVTSVLQQTSITDLFNQWEGEFDAWFANIKAQLEGDVATNLQRQIDELKIATGSTVTDGTASDIGIASGSTVDKAIDSLAVALNMMKNNNGYLTVTVLNSSNSQPIGDVLVNGIMDSEGNAVYTDEDGIASGYASEGSQTISISNYADITDISSTIAITKGNFHTLTLNATVRNFLKITSSQSVKFSGNVETVDVTVVGGGGSGGCGDRDYTSSDYTYKGIGGGGGGGGYCTVKETVAFATNTSYSAVVGAGGSAYADGARNGNAGGASSFLGVTANGGNGGSEGYYYDADNPKPSLSSYGYGGAGNGKGGNGTNAGGYGGVYGNGASGSVAGYSSFTETTLYGGGGGGCGTTGNVVTGGSGAGYGGDAPKGNGQDGCGGGGCGTYSIGGTYYGKGGSGCVAIRMHLKSAA